MNVQPCLQHRGLTFLVDLLILTAAMAVIPAAVHTTGRSTGVGAIIALSLFYGYRVLSEAFFGASLGRIIVKQRVTTAQAGQSPLPITGTPPRISLMAAALRNSYWLLLGGAMLLPDGAEAAITAVIVFGLMISLSRDPYAQSLVDRAAGTSIVTTSNNSYESASCTAMNCATDSQD